MLLKTFAKGGIHPPELKISSGKEIEKLPVPETVTIPVSQHIGAPSKVLVKRGDAVKTGQLIAESTGFVSANTHASVTGTVIKIDSVTDTSGYRRPAVVVKTENDEWVDGIDLSSELKKDCGLEKDEIIQKILEAGIVGLGGATFPSHVKLSVPKGKKAEYLILNGVECEPYLTADHSLMLEKGEEILAGASILMKALGVEKCIIGIENNKPDAIAHLSTLSAGDDHISIQALKVKYPQGGEKQLVKALLDRSVPSGGLPIDVGVVVFNVGSVFAVYEAVQKNKPLIERVVTITGKSVSNPSNLLVRIGTPVSALIDAAGGLPEDTGKIVSGGPMMGKALNSLDTPIMKGSSGVLIIPEKESRRDAVRACIRCTKCVSACPMGLEPYLLMTEVQKEKYEMAEQDMVMDCIECGSCSYICPSNRPLLDYIRLGKVTVGKIIRSRK